MAKHSERSKIRAVKRVEAGESPEAASDAVGFHRGLINNGRYAFAKVALKCRKAVGSAPKRMIREKFGVSLSDVLAGWLRRKLGLPPQRPLRRACQRDEERVEAWR